ncbi:choice-of-anchor C family protein [Actinosynnema sp. NPDC050801]|uniref:choice-of-anchor C family protein n=1 Tax=unclassified Actinosynnema TaxID=2637065 RepID=UPI0033D1D011
MRSWRSTALCATLATLMTVALAPPAGASVDDGGFESPTVPANTFTRYGVGASLGAWTVTANDVDLSGAGFWQTAEGNQSLDLDGGAAPGAVSQTIDTVPLFAYRISYRLAGNTGAPPTLKTGRILVDGNVLQDFSFDITGKSKTNMGYVGRQAVFVATGFTTTITFASTTGSGWGPVIDKVGVDNCLPLLCL